MWQTEVIVTLILDDGHAQTRARLYAAHIVQLLVGVLLEGLLDLLDEGGHLEAPKFGQARVDGAEEAEVAEPLVHGDCGSHSVCSVSSTSRAKRGRAVPGGAPGRPEQLAGIHTSRPVRCAAELRRWRQALGAWFVQTILDASERLLAGVDLMNRLGRRCAVERLVERPRERRTTLEGLVLGERRDETRANL